MKKFSLLALLLVILFSLGGCEKSENTIRVCASDVPHKQILEGYVAKALSEKGYTLKVVELDWTMQNDAVANGDYDANYFQHLPYLEAYTGKTKLVFTCTVHYEPLGIYQGSGAVTDLALGKTFSICDDESNAIRAFNLLANKGVISQEDVPVKADNNDKLEFNNSGWNSSHDKWTNGNVTVSLVQENLLVQTKQDYDFTLLPCNTAYTGKVSSELRVAAEDDINEVVSKANGLAVRKDDYLNNESYKKKIDALTDVLLSDGLANYFAETYLGVMTCNDITQRDLRALIK